MRRNRRMMRSAVRSQYFLHLPRNSVTYSLISQGVKSKSKIIVSEPRNKRILNLTCYVKAKALDLARIPDSRARTCLRVLCRRDFAWAREGKGREVGAGGRWRVRGCAGGRGNSSDGRQSHELSREYCAELVRMYGREGACLLGFRISRICAC